MMIKNGVCYYYAYNGQGDVIGLYNDQLEWVARYQYDSWGKLLSITDSAAAIILPRIQRASVTRTLSATGAITTTVKLDFSV